MNYIYILSFVIVWIKEKPNLSIFKIKPFNCELCMGFWVTLIYEWHTDGNVFNSFLVSLSLPLILNLYNKLWHMTLK